MFTILVSIPHRYGKNQDVVVEETKIQEGFHSS